MKIPSVLRLYGVLFVLLFAFSLFAGDPLEEAKKRYDFENWKGKDGALKQGVPLAKAEFPGFALKQTRSRIRSEGETILRYGDEKSISFEAAVRVLDSCADAQEALVKFLASCTNPSIPGGAEAGIGAGDVCFAAKSEETLSAVVFVRNNIFIKVSLAGKSGAVPDLKEIAEKVDNLIKSQEEAKEAKDLAKPVISEFCAAENTIAPDTPVQVNLAVSDPKGSQLTIEFDEGGGVIYEEDGKRFFKAEQPGTYTVRVFVINERFLLSKSEILITVKD